MKREPPRKIRSHPTGVLPQPCQACGKPVTEWFRAICHQHLYTGEARWWHGHCKAEPFTAPAGAERRSP